MINNFGGLSEEFTQYNYSEIVVLPIPYDGTSTWIKGADKGPAAIIEASANMELYDIDTDTEVFRKGICTLPAIITNNKSPEQIVKSVSQQVKDIFSDDKFPVLIGGEHSVSIGGFQAAARSFKNLTILQLDAHADLRASYEDSEYNHACVMARARELAPIVQVGIRSMDISDKEYLDTRRVFFANDIHNNSLWMEKALNFLSENVYVSIDLDVFDPALVPATGTPEPGGLDYYTVLSFLRKVNKKSNIIGFDVVELCPIDGIKAPDFLASKLIYQFLSYKFFD